MGKPVTPGYQARFLYYTRAGDHTWPHPDDPDYDVNLLIGIDHVRPPSTTRTSAFLAYHANGSVDRYVVAPGSAIAVESKGLVHRREPVVDREQVVLLSIFLRYAVGP
jgi:hypothetical protein